MAVEKIQGQLVIEIDKNQAKKTQGELDVFARDTGKKLDKVRMNKLADDLAKLQIEKKRLDAQFRQNERLYAKGIIDRNKLIASRKAVNDISSSVTEAKRRLQNFKNTGDPALSRLQKKFNDVGRSGQFVRNTIVSIGGAIASYISVRKVGELSESFTNLQNRLKQVADEGPQLDELTRKIFEGANSARTSVEAYASAFARFDLVNKQLGGSQEETLVIMDSLSKGLSATGAQASEVNSVMLQLAQAFGSGRLAGDEFRSVSENMPILLDILAKRLGVARGELKEMAADGLITSEVLKGALIDANEQLNESFEKSSVTIGQSMTLATNKFIAKFGELDESFNLTEKITGAIASLSNGLVRAFEIGTKFSVGFSLAMGTAANGVNKFVISAKGGFDIIIGTVKETFSFVSSNLGILAENIGIAFGNIPNLAKKGLNTFLTNLQGIVNSAINILNRIPKVDISPVDLGIDVDEGTTQALKTFKSFNADYISEINKRTKREQAIQDDALDSYVSGILKAKKVEEGILRKAGGVSGMPGVSGGSTGGGAGKSAIDEEKEALKELEEMKEKEAQAEERRNDWKLDQIEDLEEAQKSYTETFEESMKKSEENAENLRKKIEEVEGQIESLQDLEKDKGEVLSERALGIEEEILKLKEERKEAEFMERRALKEKINALIEEQQLIQANTTEAERAEAKRVEGLSETEKFLEEFAKKQEEISGGKTEEQLQEELASLNNQLTQEEEAYAKLAEAKEIIEQNYADRIKTIQESITSVQVVEDEKRIESLRRVEEQAIRTARALRSAGQGGSSRREEKPNNTINNNPNVTVNANISNNIDVENLGNELADKVSLSSKGIY